MYVKVLVVLILFSTAETSEVSIDKIGALPPNRGDVALKIYATVHNRGWTPVSEVVLVASACCFTDHTDEIQDICGLRSFLGDRLEVLHAKEVKNLTLIYPTLYPYERNGYCDMKLTFVTQKGKAPSLVVDRMDMNTELIDSFGLPKLLQGWLMGIDTCRGEDKDQLRNCARVLCLYKYSGLLNYFNKTSSKCEPMSVCKDKDLNSLPSVAFDMRKNTCRDLETIVTYKDVPYFYSGVSPVLPFKKFDPISMVNVVCVNGKKASKGQDCDCDEGWTTLTLDYSAYNPRTRELYVCNNRQIKVLGYTTTHTELTLLLCGCILSLFIVLLIVAVVIHEREGLLIGYHRIPRSDDTCRKQNCPQKVHTENLQSLFEYARVHTPNSPLENGELDLRIGDFITSLEKTPLQGVWKGECNGVVGIFPISCAQIFRVGQQPREEK